MNPCSKILITSGDVDGIGLEVARKALFSLGPQSGAQMILWASESSPRKQLEPLAKKFSISWVSDLGAALELPTNKRTLICIRSRLSPAIWVEQSAKACFERRANSLVTGPLSKQEIRAAGLGDLGHTDILKRISGKRTAFMGFLGPKFNLILATGHIPLSEVESALTADVLDEVLSVAHASRALLKSGSKKPIAVLGLNPHAGDGSLIGSFDDRILRPEIQKRQKKLTLVGPLVPDAAFVRANWNKFSFFVALYHDQGLIPFKAVHGYDEGVHLTLGLPIRRTSVDHGTAKDIFGKNCANPGSMTEAIRWGIRLAKRK